MLISVKCVERYWRSENLPPIQIMGGCWGTIAPRGAVIGWCTGSGCGDFCTRFANPENGKKDYSQFARDSIIAALPVSQVDCIDPHFADLDMEDPLNFCRGVFEVCHRDNAAQCGITIQNGGSYQIRAPRVYAALRNAAHIPADGIRETGAHIPDLRKECGHDACLICVAVEQKKGEVYIAAVWDPCNPAGEAEWIFRGALEELRQMQRDVRAVMAESATAHADGVASYTARVKAWLDAHVMESYARENVPLMTEEEAEAWRGRMIAEAAKATPWADPFGAAEAPKKRRRKDEEEVVAV